MKHHHHEHKHRQDADRRLSRIAGHIEAIRRMIREERDCPELLVQIGAVRAAIEQVGLVVLKDHLSACLHSKRSKTTLRDLSRALDQFVR